MMPALPWTWTLLGGDTAAGDRAGELSRKNFALLTALRTERGKVGRYLMKFSQ
jgi:hypothetical protein